MSTFSKIVVLFTLALSASSLATPHAVRSLHDHHAIAARKAVADPLPGVAPYGDSEFVKVVKPRRHRKRGDTNRCSARSSSAAASSATSEPSSASSSSVFSTSVAIPTTDVANVGAAPSSTSEDPAPTTSSTFEAPAPAPTTSSTSVFVAPTTSSTSEAPAATTAASSNSGQSFLSGTQTGQGTFYAIGLGSCGVTNSGSDKIAAVSHLLFDSYPGYDGVNPNNNPVCGKSITATYQGKSVTVTVEDRCTGCALTDLDFSPTAFDELASESVGRLDGMTWVWN